MNKIDIILIYLILIISFVCIIKIYLNNKNIEKFYSFNKEFSGVMRFIDDENETKHLGSYPDTWDSCFTSHNNECESDGVEYIYDSNKIKIKNSTNEPDKVIDVTNIRLPKGDTGDNGSDATMPPISFYYRNSVGDDINEEHDGSITQVTEESSHIPFYRNPGDEDKDEIKVYVKRHENCTQEVCQECKGNVSIHTIEGITKSVDDPTAVTVDGDITTNNIILNTDGKICIHDESDNNCLTYDDISKLIEWKNEFNKFNQVVPP